MDVVAVESVISLLSKRGLEIKRGELQERIDRRQNIKVFFYQKSTLSISSRVISNFIQISNNYNFTIVRII